MAQKAPWRFMDFVTLYRLVTPHLFAVEGLLQKLQAYGAMCEEHQSRIHMSLGPWRLNRYHEALKPVHPILANGSRRTFATTLSGLFGAG